MMRRTLTAQAPPIDRVVRHIAVTTRDMLGLAWLCEQAARGCDLDGDTAFAAQLRSDAAATRAAAVNQ